MIPLPPTILSAYRLSRRAADAVPWGEGHIHETYRVDVEGPGLWPRVLLQRVNEAVFPDPQQLGESIRRTTQHLRTKLRDANVPESDRRVLTLLPTITGRYGRQDEEGRWWRAFGFIEGAHSVDRVSSPEMAHAAARAFGLFQRSLADLPPPRLPETLPNFHDTPLRAARLRRAIHADLRERVAHAVPQIEFALEREGIASPLRAARLAGLIPERVTHNDSKLDNLLWDDRTGEPLCVVDLDTVMPGIGLYDFGDLVRTAACGAGEDEPNLGRMRIDPSLFRALATGYLEAMGPLLTTAEREHLVFSGRLIIFETGLRFLTDYLEGDVYFKTQHAEQNLQRCTAQFALLRSLEAQAPALEAIVRGLS